LLGIEPASGKLLWRYPFETDFNCNIATPLAHDGGIFISSGENHGCALLSLSRKDDGSFAVGETWKSFGASSVLRNEWQTSLLIDGSLFGFDNSGSAGPVTHFTCVEIASGKRRWQQQRFGKGNAIAADGKFFATTMKGELVVLRASAEGFSELGRKKMLGATRQAPALADGKLYLRDGREIVCVDVAKH
jgi:outer membrane protein assembly factor BamB